MWNIKDAKISQTASVLIALCELKEPSQCECGLDCFLWRHQPLVSLLLPLFTLAHVMVSNKICQRGARNGLELFPGWASPWSVVVLEQSKVEGWTRSAGDLRPTSPVWVAESNMLLECMWRRLLGQLSCQSPSLHGCPRLCPGEGIQSCWTSLATEESWPSNCTLCVP